jgi:hypothetical protein
MHRVILASCLFIATSAEVIRSPNSEYTVLRRIHKGTNGRLFVVRSNSGEELVLKCGNSGQYEKYASEFDLMNKFKSTNWSLKPVEHFIDSDSPCITMEQLGGDMEDIRDGSTERWSNPTVASIGIALIDALTQIHFDFDQVHSDMHPANIAVRKTDKSKLVVFDYGEMKPAPSALHTKPDIKEAMLSLRYYIDGNRRFYVAKNYSFKKEEVCTKGVPDEICGVIEKVYSSSGTAFDRNDYAQLRSQLEAVLAKSGMKYDGRIIWGTDAPALKNNQQPVDPKSNESDTSTTTKAYAITIISSVALLAVLASI